MDRFTFQRLQKVYRSFDRLNRVSTPDRKIWVETGKVLQEFGTRYGFEEKGLARLFHDVLIALTARKIGAVVYTQNRARFGMSLGSSVIIANCFQIANIMADFSCQAPGLRCVLPGVGYSLLSTAGPYFLRDIPINKEINPNLLLTKLSFKLLIIVDWKACLNGLT